MPWRISLISSLAVLSAILIARQQVLADQRHFVWTYQYQTMERGRAELEFYTTFSKFERDIEGGKTAAQHQFELEVGMTDRFDFSIYQVFASDPGEAVRYEGFKLRSRYRFGEKRRYPMDPLLYFEYKGEPEFTEHAFELKAVLARDWGGLNLAVNPILEVEKEDEWEFVMEYALGISQAVDPLLRVGVELTGGENAAYLGPVLAHGQENLWVALGSGWKISGEEGEPGFLLRLLLGVGVK